MATHSSILALEIPWTEEPGAIVHRAAKVSDTTYRLKTNPALLLTSCVNLGKLVDLSVPHFPHL